MMRHTSPFLSVLAAFAVAGIAARTDGPQTMLAAQPAAAAARPLARINTPRYRLTILDDPKKKYWMEAHSINNEGVVVGVCVERTPGGSRPEWHAFLYRNGKYNEVGVLPGCSYSEAVAINDRNEIVGTSDALGRPRNLFLWRGGHLTRLPSVDGGACSVYGIDNSGTAVGSVTLSNGRVVAAAWRCAKSGAASGPEIFDQYDRLVSVAQNGDMAAVSGVQSYLVNGDRSMRVGTLGGTDAVCTAMNNMGDVVGVSTTRTELTHAFLWRRGQIVDLSTIKSLDGTTPVLSAEAINDSGQIVGAVRNGTDTRAMIFENGHATNLNHLIPPGLITLDIARAINDRGQIIGQGHIGTRYVSYLLTPLQETKAAQPHPVSAFAATAPGYRPAGPPPGTVAAPNGSAGA